MDDAKKRTIIEELAKSDTLSQVVPDGVDVVNRYLKTSDFRALLRVADEEDLEIVMHAIEGPVILRLREHPDQ